MASISVIVPVYKVEAYLHRCIDSILSQSYSDFELILVDDGSPDRCGEICDEYAQKDARITVIHQENGGLSAARNAGIEYALGTDSEWISFIDSDDWVHPEYLKSLLGAAEQYETDIASCAFQRTDGEISAVEAISFDAISPEEYWCNSSVNATVACGKLYRKKLFLNLRYPVGKIHEDEFTTYIALFGCNAVSNTEAKMYFYFQNPDSIVHSEWTPRRLDANEAILGQISFFKTNHFPLARKQSEKMYLFSLSRTYYNAKKNPKYKKIAHDLQQNLRSAIKQYKTDLNFQYLHEAYIFEAAYPKIASVTLHTQSFIRRAGSLFDTKTL